ncbi:hypothetical protein ACFO9E_26055 [Streptomyces maoxianensis]|uniref:Uncharacterized protein n=1 Tax=Streptomyces maoxianensis TaxID=1459942 RepID=A0ABV9GAA3_9ACTN
MALSAWLLTSEDKEVAETVARLYGGKSRNCEQQTDTFEVLLDSDNIAVHVDGPASVINRLVLEEGQEPGHVCNGVRYLEPMADVGRPCGCPGTLFERKTAARSGRGPKPDARIAFRLAGAPEAGLFCVASSSWQFAESLSTVAYEMEKGGGAAGLEMRLQRYCVTTRSGVYVGYVHPVVVIAEGAPMAPRDVGLVA